MYTTIRHELGPARKAWPGTLVDQCLLSGEALASIHIIEYRSYSVGIKSYMTYGKVIFDELQLNIRVFPHIQQDGF